MNLFALIFLTSVVLCLQYNQLPQYWPGLPIVAAVPLLWLTRGLTRRLICAVLSAVFLVQLTYSYELTRQLRPADQGRRQVVQGTVVGIPRVDERRVRFRLRLEPAQADGVGSNLRLVSVNWYGAGPAAIEPGQRWRLKLRLSFPRAVSNPGGFDYAGWLFRQRVHAVAYVIAAPENRLLSHSPSLDGLRLALARRLGEQAGGADTSGLMQALLVGLRSNVSAETWALLRATGTSHLLAISGLHIGMLAAWVFALGAVLWARWQRGSYTRLDFSAWLGLAAATLYAALAGFTLPTQRALIMLAVLLLLRLRRRHADALTPVSLALILILLNDPLAPLSAGFWLSFSAVLILLGVGLRLRATERLWKRAAVTHLCMGLLMFPLTALFFSQGSLVAPVANLLAIPIVSFLVVPPLMLWLLLTPLSSFAAQLLLQWTHSMLSVLLDVLQWLYLWLPAELTLASVSPLHFGTLLCALLLLLVPVLPYQRALVLPLLLPFCWLQSGWSASERLQVTVLDAGDGLAVVIRVATYTLLYGSAGQTRAGRSRAELLLLPYFQASGLRHIDRIVLPGPGDEGAALLSVLRTELAVDSMVTTAARLPDRGRPTTRLPCRDGSRWRVAQLRFRLHSVAAADGSPAVSCVLSLYYGRNHIVLATHWPPASGLAGRVASAAALFDSAPDLLVLPASAENDILDRPSAAPRHLVFSPAATGRGKIAHEAAQMRYKLAGTTTYSTDVSGALEFSFSTDGLLGPPRSHREHSRRAWHNRQR